MRYALPAFGFALFVAAVSSFAAKITFELYEHRKGELVLLSKGTESYEPADFSMRREDRDGKFYGVRKELPLHDGYSVGTLDTQKLDVSEFGLWVGHLPFDSYPNDFSREWYKRDGDGQFTKLQGGSRISVTFGGAPLMQEIRRVEFLDDAEFDYIRDLCCTPKDDAPTHLLIIRAGSVLEFPHGS